jgi:anti-anti-sigma regulatory factor
MDWTTFHRNPAHSLHDNVTPSHIVSSRLLQSTGEVAMSSIATHQALIAYELIDDDHPEVTVIEFQISDILGPHQAHELRYQLESLMSSGVPRNVVIDFRNARMLGSSAFGVIARFVRKVWRARVCNVNHSLRLGAALIGLDEWVEFADSRESAIRMALADAVQSREETADYPVMTS